MNKKAQGLSLNTIVVAALAILVLIITALIFTGKIREANDQSNSCSSSSGECVGITECVGDYKKVLPGKTCPETDKPVCCGTYG